MKVWTTLSMLGLMVAGCTPSGGGGGGGNAPTPPDVPAKEYAVEPQELPTGPATDGWTKVEDLSFATADAPFANAISEGAMASGSFALGKWTSGNGVYAQEEPGSSTKLSIRRYTGAAFGPNGIMPVRYRVEVTGWTYRILSSNPARDAGVVILMPYYLDATHYVICSAGPSLAEAWVCKGQLPGTSWPVGNKLWGELFSPARTVGTATTWTGDVDVANASLALYLNGNHKGTFTHPLMASTSHSVALASNGAQVKFSRFRLFLPSGQSTASVPVPAPVVRPTPEPVAEPLPTPRPVTPAPRPATRPAPTPAAPAPAAPPEEP